VGKVSRRRLPLGGQPAGVDLATWRAADHLGVHPDRFGRFYVGLCVPLGRLTVEDLAGVARLARLHGDGGIRLTQRQNLVLTGVADLAGLLAEPLLERLRPSPDPFERAVLACTSAPFCKFGILNAKAYGSELIEYLRRRVPAEVWDRLQGLRLHLSGCKASCAQVQAAHIGLRATMAKGEDALADAFDIALGGDVGRGRLGRWASLEVEAPRAFEAVARALVEMTQAEEGPDAIAGAMTAVRLEEA
jgi:ferredoxin-nitrite reductase